MARKYDIIERLKAKNEKPFIVLAEDVSFNVNTEKSNVLHIIALSKDKEQDSTELIDRIIELGLGKEALAYINDHEFSFEAANEICKAIMAAVSGVDLEEMDEEEKKAKNGKK